MDAHDTGLRMVLAAPDARGRMEVNPITSKTPQSETTSSTAETTNRAVTKRQTPSDASNFRAAEAPDSLETGGCDWLESGLYGAFHRDGFQEMAVRFDALKRAALQAEGEPQPFELPDGTIALMQPYGATLGFGGMEWVFECSGIKFYVANRRISDERIGIWFCATGETCMQLGHLSVFKEVLRICGLLGFAYLRSSAPRRFDACVDLAGWDLGFVIDECNQGKCVKRFQKWKMEGEGLQTQTLQFGTRGGQQILFYDKLAELNQAGDRGERKTDYLAHNRWGGVPDKAMRVELRIKSDWLRRNTDIRSCEEFFAKLPGLLERLLLGDGEKDSIIRFVDGVPDRDNHNTTRAGVAKWWQFVVDQFLAWAGKPEHRPGRPPVRHLYGQQLFKQFQGFLASLAVKQEQTFSDTKQIASWISSQVLADVAGFTEKLTKRQAQHAATGPPDNFVDVDQLVNQLILEGL